MIHTKWTQFLPLVLVFFFWGFVGATNDVLNPVFKSIFKLSQLESQLVAGSFFMSFFVGSFTFYIISKKIDIVATFGNKKPLIVGLLLSAIGCFFYVAAANYSSFLFFLVAVFVIGLGFSVQQIIVNPLAASLGSNNSGAHRLTFAGAVNSLGTTLGALVMGVALFGWGKNIKTNLLLADVKIPFVMVGFCFVLVAVLISFLLKESTDGLKEKNILTTTTSFKIQEYPQLYLGMLAIFMYVGTEITLVSNLPALLKTAAFGTIPKQSIPAYIALYWGSLMIGRWNGSAILFKTSKSVAVFLKICLPLLAFGIVLGAMCLADHSINALLPYFFWIVCFIAISFFANQYAAKTLFIFGVFALFFLAFGLFCNNKTVALFCILSCGLFLSVMWPLAFNLAITGLGEHTNKAASFLVMMVLGGGILPLVQASICDLDSLQNNVVFGVTWTHFSYIVPLFGFAYLTFYGFYCPKILRIKEAL